MLNENDIARYVRKAVNEYFKDLAGEEPSCAIFEMVMNCVEKPLIETVMHHADGNQTRGRFAGHQPQYPAQKILERY
jgi:Fis family transcriptional regulator